MARGVALSVAFDIEPLDAPAPLDGGFPDAGMHGPAAPLDVARHSDVDGEQSSHSQTPPIRTPIRNPAEHSRDAAAARLHASSPGRDHSAPTSVGKRPA